jgi:hypothetical protein
MKTDRNTPMFTLEHLKQRFVLDTTVKGGLRLQTKPYNSGRYTLPRKVLFDSGMCNNTCGKVVIDNKTYDIRALIKCLRDGHPYYSTKLSTITPDLKDITDNGKLVFDPNQIECVMNVGRVAWGDIKQTEAQLPLDFSDKDHNLVDTRYTSNDLGLSRQEVADIASNPYKYLVKITGSDGFVYEATLSATDQRKMMYKLTNGLSAVL